MSIEINKPNFNFAIATSLVLFGFDGKDLKILLVKKTDQPFINAQVLPTQYVHPDQSIEQTIKDLMQSFSTSINYNHLEQLKAFVKVFRNPAGRIINISYYALVKIDQKVAQKTEENKGLWVPYNRLPDLAYDHNLIIEYAKERLKRRVKRRPIGFYLLPEKFTILQLQYLYEQALNKDLDKRNFRKKIFKSQLIIETEEEDLTAKKPAKLYTFDKEKYEKLSLKGYDFLF